MSNLIPPPTKSTMAAMPALKSYLGNDHAIVKSAAIPRIHTIVPSNSGIAGSLPAVLLSFP